MRLFRRMFVSILVAAVIAGAMPVALALGCIPAPAVVPCDHGGCDDADDAAPACICIHYPAPQAPGSLAVFGAEPALILGAAVEPVPPAPPATMPAREDPPDPPPPRPGLRRA